MSKADVKKRSIFFVSPIGEKGSVERTRSDWVKSTIIEAGVKSIPELEAQVTRADEIGEPGMITAKVVDRCISSDIIVVDITGHNPNVFYEYGIAHFAQRPVITLAQQGTSNPFDTKDYNTIPYPTFAWDDTKEAVAIFSNHLREILKDAYKPSNPVTVAMALKDMSKVVRRDAKDELILDMQGRLGYLEKQLNEMQMVQYTSVSAPFHSAGTIYNPTSGTIYNASPPGLLNTFPTTYVPSNPLASFAERGSAADLFIHPAKPKADSK